jgi:hypothetical protein
VVAVEVPHEGEHCGHQHQQHAQSLERCRESAENTQTSSVLREQESVLIVAQMVKEFTVTMAAKGSLLCSLKLLVGRYDRHSNSTGEEIVRLL